MGGEKTNRFTFDPMGGLRELFDGKNQLTSWGYDEYGRVTGKTNANNLKILGYEYDANSRLTHRWSQAKLDTWYSYDPVGNLTNIDYSASTDIRYKYDLLNRLTNMVDASGTTSWIHDTANRFTVEDGPLSNDNVTNRWNTAGLRTNLAILQPTSYFNVDYTYDSAKRLSSVTSGAGTFQYSYISGLNSLTTPSRLVKRLDLPNTSYITNNWDDQARLTDTYLKNSSGTALNRHSYQYNNGNQRTRQTFTDAGYVDYLYDDVGELYSARTYDSLDSEILAQRFGYDYDPAWNLNKRTNNATVSSFNVNNQNQLTSSPEGSHSHDSNGNMTQSGEYGFGYDDENQMTVGIYMAADWTYGRKTEYTYDGKMRLRSAAEYSWNFLGGTNGTWTLGTTKHYIYDGMLVVQERFSSSTPYVTYTRGNDLSGTLQGSGGIGGMLARSQGYSAGNWTTHHFYHADGNGNITYLVNSTQGLGASYKYNPFGGTISSSGAYANANTYRFSSKEYSPGNGIYYYGYRWYHPNMQRWLNRDPWQEKGGLNLYAFIKNQPTKFFDPWGLKVQICCRDLDAGCMANGAAKVIGKQHCWVSTSTKSGGMGPVGSGGLPKSPCYGTDTEIKDHSKEKPTKCYDVSGADEDCVNTKLEMGKSTGKWGIGNNCNTFAADVVRKCGGKNPCTKWVTVSGPDFGEMILCSEWSVPPDIMDPIWY